MKKQFFYAAMALAVMSSCSKDNDPGIGNPEENNDKAVIALGLDVPTVTASTRGTGSVGDVAGDQNTWNSQKLYIYMVDRNTGLEAEEGAENAKTKILDNGVLEFRAPKADAKDKGAIRIYKTYTEDSDNGVIQYKYYPTNGQYTFYGYHIDDAANANPSITATEKKVTGVTIDGTQDLLAAKTIDMAENDASATDPESFYKDIATSLGSEWTTLMNYQFGARTARKGIVPVLKFEHQLARLKFFVRAGSKALKAAKVLCSHIGSALGKQAVRFHIPQHLAAVLQSRLHRSVLRFQLGVLFFEQGIQLLLVFQQSSVQVRHCGRFGLWRFAFRLGRAAKARLSPCAEHTVHKVFPIVGICHGFALRLHRFLSV